MNTVERRALEQSARHYGEMTAIVDERTIDIVDRRRRTAIVKRRGWLVRRALIAADVFGLVCALFSARALGGSGGVVAAIPDHPGEFATFLVTLPGWIVMAKLYGLYEFDERRTDHTTADDISGVFHMMTVGAWLFLVGSWVAGFASPDLTKLALFWTLAIVFVTVGRALARAVYHRRFSYFQNTVIVGADEVGQLIARKLLQHSEYAINLVGFIDIDTPTLREEVRQLPILGPPELLPAVVRLFDIERAVIAFTRASWERTLGVIRALIDLEVQVDLVPRYYEVVGPGVGIHTIEGLPLLGLPAPRLSPSSRLVKRTVDLCVSVVALIVLAPLLVVIGILIKLDSVGPVLFRQVRMGSGDKTFRILKFRTMTANAEEQKAGVAHLNKHRPNGRDPRMFKIPGDPRTTRVGAFLRRYCLDEIPQLINVLKGDMSLVGPRPLILDEDVHVNDWRRKRLDLKPGMTGLWQVHGRSDIPFDEMVNLDYLYVISWSPFKDLKLMLRTIPAVLHAREAY